MAEGRPFVIRHSLDIRHSPFVIPPYDLRMRVVQCVHRYPPALGGSEAFFARLSRFLAGRGDQVRVFTTNAMDLEAFWSSKARRLPAGIEHHDGVQVHRFRLRHWPGQRLLLKLLSPIPYRPLQCGMLPCNPVVPEMWTACGRARDVDVVHASAFPYALPLLCALRLARRLGVPFLLTPFLHLGDSADPNDRTRKGYLSPPMQYLLCSADGIFVQTGIERDAVLKLGIPAERVVLLGMGVDVEECTGGDRRRGRQRWGISPDEVVVGHLANKSVEKGTVDLIEAAKRLWKQGVRFRLLLAGPEMPNFTQYWRRQVVNEPVTRLGVLSEAEKRDFYAASDLFAMPSRSDSFGIVFLEAWANGLPCVAYRAGGVPGVIRHEEDGLLVDCGNIEALSNAIRRLVADGGVRRRLGEEGRRRVARDSQWQPRLELVRATFERMAGVRGE
jgi:glycosyltransferase involved in cell wall biosynthesis